MKKSALSARLRTLMALLLSGTALAACNTVNTGPVPCGLIPAGARLVI